MDINILIVGVGGQGTLLASRILGQIAAIMDKDCKLSEVHGMAQRGGSVVTHVKIADKVNTPIIGLKEADILLAFEQLEAITGAREYPQDIIENIKKRIKNAVFLDAVSKAEELGNIKTVNVIMIGALIKRLGIDINIAKQALQATVKEKFLDLNIKALEIGYSHEWKNKRRN